LRDDRTSSFPENKHFNTDHISHQSTSVGVSNRGFVKKPGSGQKVKGSSTSLLCKTAKAQKPSDRSKKKTGPKFVKGGVTKLVKKKVG